MGRRNKKAEENAINNTANDVSVKKSKKRKAEDWNDLIEEEEAFLAKENATPQQQPINAWMKIVQTKSEKKEKKSAVTGEPPAKKKKKKDKEIVEVEEIEKESGTFKKIF